ncbi:hypothetical protein FDP41_011381 [Naegleria fowleri]|uniref:Deacetylase sirtuin-type domain-containing protein n=1 Tax=Naegleria fowleri TaxID=5763 RepID=A0A6A5C5T9_NAEFO|nr:uncharacterized protein FDP41_011381 [Naegleria fowleri]KAF0982451.1 hypothetical protein FDP41_011381 [Naegleria fowleri]CAG4718271.1 unnamed protein product [Naegleria fowleri]
MNKLMHSIVLSSRKSSSYGVFLRSYHHNTAGVRMNQYLQSRFMFPKGDDIFSFTRNYFTSVVNQTYTEETNKDDDMGYSKIESQSRLREKVSLSKKLKQRALENQFSLEEAINVSTNLIYGKKNIVVMIGPVASTQSRLPKDVFEQATSRYYQQHNSFASHIYGDLHILYNIDNKAIINSLQTEDNNMNDSKQDITPQRYSSGRSKEGIQLQNIKENTIDDLYNSIQFMSNPTPTLQYLQKLHNTFNKNYSKGTPVHDFLLRLKKENKLLRVYTESIDGIEQNILGDNIVVNCLGSLNGFHCDVCGKELDFTSALSQFPNRGSSDRNIRKGKCELMSKQECGLIPNLVLENDTFPKEVRELGENDISESDMIIVIGTPLSRQPLSGLMKMASQNKNITTLWILPRVLLDCYQDNDIPNPLQEFANGTSSRNNVIVLPDEVTIDSFVSSIQTKLLSRQTH